MKTDPRSPENDPARRTSTPERDTVEPIDTDREVSRPVNLERESPPRQPQRRESNR